MEQLQARLQEIQAELRTLSWSDVNQQPRIMELQNEESDIGNKLRNQQQTEHLDNLTTVVQDTDIFAAVFPPEMYKQMMGINIYSEKQQEVNELVYLLSKELQEQLISVHNQEIAAKDEKIAALNKQGLEIQQKYDTLKVENDQVLSRNVELVQKLAEAEQELSGTKFSLEQAQKIIEVGKPENERLAKERNDLQAQVAELQGKLDTIDKQKEAIKPSQSFQDRLKEVKDNAIKTSAQLALERAQSGQAPVRGKVTMDLPSISAPALGVTQPVGTFPEVNPANAAVSGIPAAQEVTFRGETATTPGPQMAQGTPQTDGAVHETSGAGVSREEFEALKERVSRIEGRAQGAA